MKKPRIPPSPQVQAIVLLLALVALGLASRWMPPIPEWWSGFLMGAFMAYALTNLRVIKCRQQLVFKDLEFARQLELWTERLDGAERKPQP